MVLISMENLERMQQQLQQCPPTITAESKENALPPTPENVESANSFVQTLASSRFTIPLSFRRAPYR